MLLTCFTIYIVQSKLCELLCCSHVLPFTLYNLNYMICYVAHMFYHLDCTIGTKWYSMLIKCFIFFFVYCKHYAVFCCSNILQLTVHNVKGVKKVTRPTETLKCSKSKMWRPSRGDSELTDLLICVTITDFSSNLRENPFLWHKLMNPSIQNPLYTDLCSNLSIKHYIFSPSKGPKRSQKKAKNGIFTMKAFSTKKILCVNLCGQRAIFSIFGPPFVPLGYKLWTF